MSLVEEYVLRQIRAGLRGRWCRCRKAEPAYQWTQAASRSKSKPRVKCCDGLEKVVVYANLVASNRYLARKSKVGAESNPPGGLVQSTRKPFCRVAQWILVKRRVADEYYPPV